jgi:predicted RND superfamily exporter protein
MMAKFFKHPWLILAVIAVITGFFAVQLPRAELDNSLMGFLPKTNTVRQITEGFEETYGNGISIFVGLRRPYDTVFDADFLSRMREFTDAVETVPLFKRVNSILTTQYITADADSIIVTNLVNKNFLGSPEEITELKQRLASWDLYEGFLVSDDFTATQVLVDLDVKLEDAGSPAVTAALTQIRDMAKKIFEGSAEVYTAGQPLVMAALSESMRTDLALLIPFVIIVLVLVLVLSFRRFAFVALPLLTVLVAVIWTIGAMPLFGVRLSILSSVLPVVLAAVGSAYGIHIVSHYRDEIRGASLTIEGHRALVFSLMRKLLKPVFLAALTTFAGFISFCFTNLTPIREFGYFSSFGVIASFVVAVTLVPSLLLLRGRGVVKIFERETEKNRREQKKTPLKESRFDRALGETLCTVAAKRTPVLIITVFLVVLSVWGLTRVIVDNSVVDYFRDDTEIARGDLFIRKYFGGSKRLGVSVEAETTEIALHPATLGAIDGLCGYLTGRVPLAGKVSGFTAMIKRMNQMFNVGEPPEGIRANKNLAEDDTDTDEFGFGNFGFGGEDGGGVSPAGEAGGKTADFEAQGPDLFRESAASPSSHETAITFAMLNAALGKNADMSANDLIHELERMTNYEGYAYYEIPADPARYGKMTDEELQLLVSNYLVLLSGDTNHNFSNDPLEPTALRTEIQVRSQWQDDVDIVVDEIDRYIAGNFPDNVTVKVGGGAMLEGASANLVVSSQTVSIFVSVLIVLLILALSYRSLAAGLIGALPLSIAILCNFALMGILGIRLNMGTALIASVSVGTGIDYTIHFIEAFKREYQTGGGTAEFLYRTFSGCGKAIVINAVSVGAGFAVLEFSQFRIIAQFGALVAFSMGVSAVVSLTVIPALLNTAKPQFIYGKNSGLR